jgi:CubicO group peptidase (beta-lactamase class C family)
MIYHHFQSMILLSAGVGLLFGWSGQKTIAATFQTEPAVEEIIDAYVVEQMSSLDIPGMAVGVVRGDEVIHMQGYGIADDSGRAMTTDTPFLIASLSKSITALGIMQLVEEGKIDLDTPVQTYVPWFRVADEEESSLITIRHLLNQTSGLSEREGYVRNLDRNPADSALETSVRNLHTQALNSPPGTAFEYSNTNYDVLGLLIQTVSGQSYESYVQDRIFTPLHMNNSYTSLADARAASMTRGYYSFFGFPVAYDHVMPYSRIILPSAGLFSSAEDLTHYLIAHLNQGRYQGHSILSPDGIDELHTPAVSIGETVSYAMGWVVFPFTNAVTEAGGPVPTAISHGGQWVGFESNMVIILEQELGVVVLVNKSDPASGSAFANLGWNISLLALGLEPVNYPTADFITRYGRGLLVGVILLLGFALVWSARKLRRLSSQDGTDARQGRKLTNQMILLALVDLILAGWLLFIKLPGDNDTLALALHFNPDIGLMYVLLLVLTLGGIFFRTILLLVYASRKDRSRSLA